MNPDRTRRRRRTLIILASIAGALLVGLFLTGLGGEGRDYGAREGRSVFPQFGAELRTARIIRVRLGDVSYTLARAEPGSEDWQMIETGGYPVRADRLAALAEGLSTLRWGAARTADPSKFDRIGVGDPAEGGSGAHIEVLTEGNSPLATLITGRREERLYGRLPGEGVSYRLEGNLPPLYTREAWLDFDIVDMLPDVISGVRLTEASGRSVYLQRAPGGGPRDFAPGPPYEDDRLVSRLTASSAALALSRLAPIDAKPAAALETPFVARHITTTQDGLEVSISAFREPDGFYITLRAVEAGEGAARAETINARAEPWAFKLTEFDWGEFVTPIEAIVARP